MSQHYHVCVLLPEYFLRCEEAFFPARGQQAYALHTQTQHPRVATCNLKAQNAGVGVGQTQAQAVGLCPELCWVPVDEGLVAHGIQQLLAPLGLQGVINYQCPDVLVFISLTQRPERGLIQQWYDQLCQGSACYAARIAIAETALVAELLVSHPQLARAKVLDGLEQSAASWMASLPISSVPALHSVDELCQAQGWQLCGELQALSQRQLQQAFGHQAKKVFAVCQGTWLAPYMVTTQPRCRLQIAMNACLQLEQTLNPWASDLRASYAQIAAAPQIMGLRLSVQSSAGQWQQDLVSDTVDESQMQALWRNACHQHRQPVRQVAWQLLFAPVAVEDQPELF